MEIIVAGSLRFSSGSLIPNPESTHYAYFRTLLLLQFVVLIEPFEKDILYPMTDICFDTLRPRQHMLIAYGNSNYTGSGHQHPASHFGLVNPVVNIGNRK